MKTLSLRFCAALIAVITVFIACSDSKNKTAKENKKPDSVLTHLPDSVIKNEMSDEEMMQGKMVFKDTVSPEFKAGFQRVVNAYLSIKNGFVNEHWEAIDQQVAKMQSLLNSFPDNSLSGEAQLFWKEKKAFLQEHLNLHKDAKTKDAKRENFVFLSSAMIKSVTAFGSSNQNLFIDFCPMANQNKGAYWLSETKQIQNPYMGKKMPNCGEVRKEL